MSVLRRMMMDGFNIDAIPSSRKIYYTASEKITPRENSLGSKVQVNMYNATTMNGVLVTTNDITSIGNSAFENKGITSITIPDSVTYIGKSAFNNCQSLNHIIIPNSVTSIGNSAFYYCRSLTNITVPNSVTSIEDYAFLGCSNLIRIVIPESVTSVGYYVFNDCTGELIINSRIIETNYTTSNYPLNKAAFTKLTIGDNVSKIGNNSCRELEALTSVNLPNSITEIGENAFSGCYSLTSITIPDSVTEIGAKVFAGCSALAEFKGKFATDDGRCLIINNILTAVAPRNLKEYIIPNNVTGIGYYAFNQSYSLKNVTIPNSVTSIGDYAFYSCSALTSVYCKATTPPSLDGTWVFDYNGSGRKIYVPMESVDAYKSATNWSEYADAIEGYEF